MSIEIFNYTPHNVVIYDSEGANIVYEFKSSGIIRGVSSKQTLIEILNDIIPIVTPQRMENLETPPNYNKDQNIIISMLCVSQLLESGHRGNIYTPDSGPDSVVRDNKGSIIGVKRLELHTQNSVSKTKKRPKLLLSF